MSKVKMRYVAQIVIEDETEATEDEFKRMSKNVREGAITKVLESTIESELSDSGKVEITEQFADVLYMAER